MAGDGVTLFGLELIVNVLAALLGVSVQILHASMNSWRYLFSRAFREKKKVEWENDPGLKRQEVVRGGIVWSLSLAAVWFLGWFFYVIFFAPEPEPSDTEKLMGVLGDALQAVEKEMK